MYYSVYYQCFTQKTKLKPDQILFYNTIKSERVFFLSKSIKVFQWLFFISFLNKVNPNNGNKRKSDIFSRNIFKSDTMYLLSRNIISILFRRVFQRIQIQNFSTLCLTWTQTMEMKQNQTFFIRQIEIWYHFSYVTKYWNISVTFLIAIF